MNILMIGCGKMAGSMLRRWQDLEKYSFTIVDPALERAPEGIRLHAGFPDVEDQKFDLLIVGIKPQMVNDILPQYKSVMADDGFALSIAAGVPAGHVATLLGGRPVVRVMPNLPTAYGVGMSAIYKGKGVSEAQAGHVETLIEATGKFITVEEEDRIDRFTAIAGSGPGYVFEFMNSFASAATELGFDAEEARMLAVETVLGTAHMASHEERALADLRDDVTSPNGTTQAGLDVLRRGGDLADLLRETTEAAYRRACELR
jgi:pyrroline-5-carboxylate reductase|tara:strand:- start:88844 stop:89623 length:780 start_codon:yes stop_codon:yes gene_type:complete